MRGRSRARLSAAALLAALLVIGAGEPARAVEPNVYLAPSIWSATATGEGDTGSGTNSEQFDYEDTLGLDNGDTFKAFEGFLRVGTSRYIFSYSGGNYEGDRKLDETLAFDNQTFPSGTKIDSELNVDRKRYLYGRPMFDGKVVSFGYLLGWHEYSVETIVRASGFGSQRLDIDSGIPVIGATVTAYPIQTLRLYAELCGMSVDKGGVDSQVIEFYGVGEYSLGKYVAIGLGYRYATLNADEEDEGSVDVKQIGPFTGLIVRF